jgi:uroporphyrinogen-III decarboxylase
MEVKAGMDIGPLHARLGDRLAFFGNIDARALIANDRAWIDRELEARVRPLLAAGGAYILMSDHSIPPQVDFATMQYFFARGRELSRALAKG